MAHLNRSATGAGAGAGGRAKVVDAAAGEAPIQLTIRAVSGREVVVSTLLSNSVTMLRADVAAKLSVLPAHLVLLCRWGNDYRELEDGPRPLSDYGLQGGSCLRCDVRLAAGLLAVPQQMQGLQEAFGIDPADIQRQVQAAVAALPPDVVEEKMRALNGRPFTVQTQIGGQVVQISVTLVPQEQPEAAAAAPHPAPEDMTTDLETRRNDNINLARKIHEVKARLRARKARCNRSRRKGAAAAAPPSVDSKTVEGPAASGAALTPPPVSALPAVPMECDPVAPAAFGGMRPGFLNASFELATSPVRAEAHPRPAPPAASPTPAAATPKPRAGGSTTGFAGFSKGFLNS